MSTPEITSVSFNIKSPDGNHKSYDLGKKTLIVGPNGIGKSAVVQAVALAISGAAEEVAGRAITSDPGMLMTLAHQHGRDGSVVFARVNLSNGEHCQWETRRDEGRIKTPLHIKPKWVIPHTSKQHSPHFPMREVREVLTGSAKKARERFLAWVCSDLDDDVVEAAMREDFEMFKKLTVACEDMVAVDQLMHSIDIADKQARQLRGDAKSQSALRNKLLEEVGAKPSEAAVLAARDAVREARKLHEANVAGSGAQESDRRRALLHDLLGQLRSEEQRVLSDMKESEKTFNELEALATVESQGSIGALHALNWAIDESAEACPICSSAVGSQHIVACRDLYSGKVDDLDKKMSDRHRLEGVLRHLGETLTGVREQISAYEDELEDLPASVASSSDVSVDQTRDALAATQAKLDNLNESRTKWQTLISAKNLIENNQAEAEKFARYKKAAQKVVSKLLADRVDSFCDKVSAYLPEGWEFGVMVTDNGRDSFYYGLYENDGSERYLKVGLSEAQRISVTIAMCAALDDMMPLPLSVLAPEDRGWDADTLGQVMQSLRSTKQTVLLTSTVKPVGEYCKGWTVIELGDQPTAARPKMSKAVLPTADDSQTIEPTPAMIELPEALQERYAPSNGRARGGKFRAIKRQVNLFVNEHGIEVSRCSFRLAHPQLVVEDETSPEDFAVTAANFLVPLGPQ